MSDTTTTSEVDLEELTRIVVSNLVDFAESAGGVGQIEFGAFVGALAGGYADLGVDLDMRYASSTIATWCGFAGVDVPNWCVNNSQPSVKTGRAFREMAESVYAELRRHGKSINDKDVTIIARRAKGASA